MTKAKHSTNTADASIDALPAVPHDARRASENATEAPSAQAALLAPATPRQVRTPREGTKQATLIAKVHAILTESPRKRAAQTRADTPALLRGLLYGPDGAAFSPTHTRKGGRLYRYYVSQTVLKHGAGSCPVSRVPADEIEAAVIDQLRAVFRQPEIVAGTGKAARAQDDEVTEAEVRDALTRLDPLWNQLFPAEQARIVALLVERVDIGTEGMNVRLRMDGLASLAHEMNTNVGQAA